MWRPLCLIACFLVTLACGTVYTFSAYAPQLCTRLNLSVQTGSAIGMAANFSMALSGPAAGILVDRRGYTLPVIISLLSTFIGYGIINYCYFYIVPNVSALTLAMILVGLGSTFAFSAAVKCAAVNFTKIRGTATAITMSGFGLSAFFMSIFTKLIDGSSNPITFLQVLLVLPTVLLSIGGPIMIFFQTSNATKSVDTTDESAMQLVKRKTFWLYFVILGLIGGIGQSYIYTCGYIVKALTVSSTSPSPNAQSTQVAFLSIANCVGRLIGGIISDAIYYRLKKSRANSLFLSALLCVLASWHISQTTNLSDMTHPTLLTGCSYGILFGSFPGVVSDEFGVQNLSFNWGLVSLSPIFFAPALTIRLGHIYDEHAVKGVCSGNQCFRSGHQLHCFIGLLGAVLVAYVLELEKPRSLVYNKAQ